MTAVATRRRVLTWTVIGIVFVLLGALLWAAQSAVQRQDHGRLHPENHGPDGFRALASVLREHGVDVRITDSWEDARDSADGATLAFTDAPALSDDAIDALLASGADVVLLEPSSRTLDRGVGASFGSFGDTDAAACSFAPAENAGDIGSAQLYTGGDETCFRSSDDAAIVIRTDGGRTVAAVDGTSLFTNATITTAGNAALGLGLLGQNDTLVWYVPSATDSDLTGEATIADLVPGWVTPVILLGGLTAVAAGIWRGRRFGPLVPERLPVTVRVSETLEGRARLYARSRDAAHAASVMRRASAADIGARLGLGRHANVLAVADAAAAALGAQPGQVRAILAGPAPTTDAALLRLSDGLTRLEAAIGAAVRAEGKRP